MVKMMVELAAYYSFEQYEIEASVIYERMVEGQILAFKPGQTRR